MEKKGMHFFTLTTHLKFKSTTFFTEQCELTTSVSVSESLAAIQRETVSSSSLSCWIKVDSANSISLSICSS